MEKKSPLNDLMRSAMEKVREMADTNAIVGQPITTPDGVTLIPISRVSLGFGCGGGDYGKTQYTTITVKNEVMVFAKADTLLFCGTDSAIWYFSLSCPRYRDLRRICDFSGCEQWTRTL